MGAILSWIEAHQGLAAWLQGIASVAAILGAAWLSREQSAADRKTALEVVRATKRQADLQLAQAVTTLVRSAHNWLINVRREVLTCREDIYQIATAQRHYDATSPARLEDALKSVPLHDLVSPGWVVNVLSAISTIEQAQRHINKSIEFHREMDAAMYGQLFESLDLMKDTLGEIAEDLSRSVADLRVEATESGSE